ncbi:MAG: abortive infection system antitoxin AbiGi family protein [Bacillota bacterium]|nr:abortive infection system antitoxin AbiGi family protein [Bacillota bacterium]
MNNISANTLFHFTRNTENLINILMDGFYPMCCVEDLGFIYEKDMKDAAKTGFAIPMVCFCDIPLSQISNHVEKFGGYAIGLSKSWGESKGINPVMYELPNSNAIETIRASIGATIPYLTGRSLESEEYQEKMRKLANELIFFSCYLKQYKGQKWDGEGFSGNEIMFYDEKEWRYIPSYNKIIEKSIKPYLFSHEFMDERKKSEFNSIFKQHFKLCFKPDDIKYIIVEKENEVLDMVNSIEKIETHFSAEEIKLLITRVISVERLRADF